MMVKKISVLHVVSCILNQHTRSVLIEKINQPGIPQSPSEELKVLIEQTAHQIGADNTELACAFIQKTAIEKAIPEMDKRLAAVR